MVMFVQLRKVRVENSRVPVNGTLEEILNSEVRIGGSEIADKKSYSEKFTKGRNSSEGFLRGIYGHMFILFTRLCFKSKYF